MSSTLFKAAPASPNSSSAEALHWVLRIAVFMCFLGHGSYGIIAKPEWTPYFGVYGIPKDSSLLATERLRAPAVKVAENL